MRAARQLLSQISLALAFAASLAVTGLAPGDARAASGANKPYTVANYPVEAHAKNAVAAKDKAHADGQVAAFRSLFKRLLPVTAYHRLDSLKGLNSADFIDGVAIRSERNSSTDYIANLDFAFQADAVREHLTREGIPFVDEQASPIVLVPVMREATGADATSVYKPASTTWAGVWRGLDLENTLAPMRVDALLPVVPSDAIAMLVAGQDEGDRVLTREYKADNVVVAIAEVDRPAKRLNVTVAGHDAVGAINWSRSYRLQDGDAGYTMEFAAVVTQGVLEGRWKAVKTGGAPMAAGPSGSDIALAIEFSSLAEWNEIRRQILDMPGVDDVRIGSVSAGGAEMSLRYPGGAGPLADALAQQGLALSDNGGTWLVRANY